MHILFLFIDGIGLGASDPMTNPFAATDLPAFERLGGGASWVQDAAAVSTADHIFHGIDATLDLEGLPQSGTGQASLLTGVNCARIAGRHYGPYPHSKTRPILAQENLFRQIERLDPGHSGPAAFANAYPDRFFEYVKRTDRWTVTTRCCLDSDVRIRTEDDLRNGIALPADITGERWPYSPPQGMMPGTEEEAARRLLRIVQAHPLTLFEYYLTDKAGHSRNMQRAEQVLRSYDALLQALLEELDPANTLLVITSDHGNLEDLSVKTHTRNPVPLLAYGKGASALSSVRRIDEVTPALVSLLSA